MLRLGQYWDDAKDEWATVEGCKFPEAHGVGAAAVDWEGDGDLDLVLGSTSGHLFLRENGGTKAKHAFAQESTQLTAGEDPLEVKGGDVIPTIADWDGDGRFDILTGCGSGGVSWFRNKGTRTAPSFAPAAKLVESTGTAGTLTDPAWPGSRTQVHAADHDGDGLLDLLVGDYNSAPYVEGKDPEMHGWVWLFRRKAAAKTR